MAATRLLMRKLRDLLRLKYEAGLSHRAIARACSIGVSTVSVHLKRVIAAGLRWPLPADLDDAAPEARLFASPDVVPAGPRPLPDWRAVHRELKRPSVTLRLVWLEHRDVHPTGYGYSQFCDRYRRWAQTLKPSMRQWCCCISWRAWSPTTCGRSCSGTVICSERCRNGRCGSCSTSASARLAHRFTRRSGRSWPARRYPELSAVHSSGRRRGPKRPKQPLQRRHPFLHDVQLRVVLDHESTSTILRLSPSRRGPGRRAVECDYAESGARSRSPRRRRPRTFVSPSHPAGDPSVRHREGKAEVSEDGRARFTL
jgi:hypothetical protein